MAVAQIDVGEPVPLVGQRPQRFGQQAELFELERELARLRHHHPASRLDVVGDIDVFQRGKARAHHVLLGEELNLAAAVAQAEKADLTHAASGQDTTEHVLALLAEDLGHALGRVAELVRRSEQGRLRPRAQLAHLRAVGTDHVVGEGFSPRVRQRSALSRRTWIRASSPPSIVRAGLARPRERVHLTGARSIGVLQQVGLDESVEIAVENGLDVAGLVFRAQILDQLVRLQHVASDLVAPGDLALGGLVSSLFSVAFGLFELVELAPSASSAPSPGSGAGCARRGKRR